MSAGVKSGANPAEWPRSVLRRWERGEHAELISLGVGHHYPRDVIRLTDVDPIGSEPDQPVDLRILIVRPEVEVEAVLHALGVWNLPEQDVRRDIGLGAAFWGFDDPFVGPMIRDPPAKSGGPEASETFAVGSIDDNALDPDVHDLMVLRGAEGIRKGSRH